MFWNVGGATEIIYSFYHGVSQHQNYADRISETELKYFY